MMIVVAAVALPACSGGTDNGGTGALLALHSDAATFTPTSPDGREGTLVMKAPSATADHDPSKRGAASLPAIQAAMSLRDQAVVQAVLRRPDAPPSQDAYGVDLSGVSFSTDDGFIANATVRDSVDAKLLSGDRKGLDGGQPPVDLGHVDLHAADTNVKVSGANKLEPPKSGANYNINVYVHTTFPVATVYVVTPKVFHCAKDTSPMHRWVLPDNVNEFRIDLEIDTKDSCGWDFSTAKWELSIQPPGVADVNKLYVDLMVGQITPWTWSAVCTTIKQPNRPDCRSAGTLNGSSVDFRVAPSA